MNPRSTIDRRVAAFTLMELLLAVGIFAIVLASINTVFYAALRLRNKVSHLLDETAPMQQALAMLRRDLQGAAAPGVKLAGPMQSLLAGSSMSQSGGLQFYTTTGLLTADSPWGDIQKVVYQLKPPTNGLAFAGQGLVRTVTRNLLPTAQEEYVDEFLVGNVEQLLFTYYDGTNWTDTWDSSTLGGLPTAVRVQILLVSEDPAPLARAQQPIEMWVPLMAQTLTNQTQATQ